MVRQKRERMLVFVIMIVILSVSAISIVHAISCLTDGQVFNVGYTQVARGTPVTVTNLNNGQTVNTYTGENFPPVPIFDNQYRVAFDCAPGLDKVMVFAENGTYYSEKTETVPSTGQAFINLTLDQIFPQIEIRTDPESAFVINNQTLYYIINVTNRQPAPDSFTITFTYNTDNASINQTTITNLGTNQSAIVNLSVEESYAGNYTINLTLTSTGDPTLNDTWVMEYIVSHRPIVLYQEVNIMNTTNMTLPPFSNYLNLSVFSYDLDGEIDTAQIVACNNSLPLVDGKCQNNGSLCAFLDAPTEADAVGQTLSCIYPSNETVVVFYGHACDSTGRCSPSNLGYWCDGGCVLNVNVNMTNKTFDNSPSFTTAGFVEGIIPVDSYCYYKTDYDPENYTQISPTPKKEYNVTMPEQNWTRLPTNLGRYPYIQHHDYYSGWHNLTVRCNGSGIDGVNSTRFLVQYTQRDKVYYQDGDTIKLWLTLEEPGLNVTVNFSDLDSGFTGNNYEVNNTGLYYNITYNISSGNTVSDGQKNVTIEAYYPNGTMTMNGTIFVHLHNNWQRSDIDNAFDCWSFKQGYYFDEVACDWESDLNHVADLVDVFTVEVSCFDTIDNDLDGAADINDTDCAGQYYVLRRNLSIDSAFLGDPCHNNVCRLCLGGVDSNNDGICNSGDPDGVNVQYLNLVQPGENMRVRFLKSSGVLNVPIRLSVNYLNSSFNVTPENSSIVQLPKMELGGCTNNLTCKSVTATTYNPPNPDLFTQSSLSEKITFRLSEGAVESNYSTVATGKSISGLSAFQNLVFFSVDTSGIINETDNATFCFDQEDNDLNDYVDCLDASCNQTVNPDNATQKCEFGAELTCDDGYDNDGDGYTDCQDNDCFQKNGTSGPCYAVEDYSSSSCANNVNDDFDWGLFANPGISRSFEDMIGGDMQLIDCLDIDCDGDIGSIPLTASCEYGRENTCNDAFDNDADGRYDCTGNAYRTSYERDCDRWNNPLGNSPLYQCPRTETDCDDEIDNDLDSDYPNGAIDPYLLFNTSHGGWDCQDIDCDGKDGDPSGTALCEFGNETTCDDSFDNDADGYIDCYDPTTCTNQSGRIINLTGLCRPCPEWENVTIGSCRDGKDTDANGLTDCDDPDCYGLPGPGRSYCGLTETNCTNGLDEDYDTLIDQDDPDCASATTYNDETGPGMCYDSIDNDNDGNTDCADSDCNSSMICLFGSFNNNCASIGYVGAIRVCRYRFINRGNNETFRYYGNIDSTSVVLKAGNVNDSLRDISTDLDVNETAFMEGTTTGFVFVNDTYGLKAQADSGFTGNLNLDLISETSTSTPIGWYDIFVSTSIPGVYGTKTASVYIGEDEPPTITNTHASVGAEIVTGDEVKITLTANATDAGTFNSGIAWCEFNISGTIEKENDCIYESTRSPGEYNYTVRAVDGALLYSGWSDVNVTVPIRPLQDGDFYDPYSGPNKTNYPTRDHFEPVNDSEQVNIGINFNGGAGFVDNSTGCIVTIMNKTDTVEVQNVSLNATAVPGSAICNGQINLTNIYTIENSTNTSDGVYYFTVSVYDTSDVIATSDVQSIVLCEHKYYSYTGQYVCVDPCDKQAQINNPPLFILNISNQSWPRGTSITTIDLDDHFYDPDHDHLTFNWTIDTTRINVTVNPLTHFVTLDPDSTYTGLAYITFYANDPFSSTPSNEVQLEVTYVPIVYPTIPPSGGGGGGGGATRNVTPVCEEDWICSRWSICFPNGFQTRTCRDLNECGSQMDRPETTQACNYIPTCRDRIKNQAEEGIDCGGPCPPCESCEDNIQNRDETGIDCGGVFCSPCPTCNDNIKNQGEEGVDCGGPCPSCATCNDGIQNQGEMNIDCGGPCVSCRVRVIEQAVNWHGLMLVISLALLAIVAAIIMLTRLLRKKYLRIKAKSLNYYMRVRRMFEKKKIVEKEIPILKWVNTHLDKIDGESTKPGKKIIELDKLVRIFLKRLFFIRYSFTDEELNKEVKKHNISATLQKAISILLEELAQIKYGGEDVDDKGVSILIAQIKVITERLIDEMEKKHNAKIGISEKDIEKIDKSLGNPQKPGVENPKEE